jgi:hypothetical protein
MVIAQNAGRFTTDIGSNIETEDCFTRKHFTSGGHCMHRRACGVRLHGLLYWIFRDNVKLDRMSY